MYLLIDAYNVIHLVAPGLVRDFEAALRWLVARLGVYRAHREGGRCEIIAVFDGGMFSHKVREVVNGIVVVHAGRGRKADDVLVHYAKEFSSSAVLVSNDRELRGRAALHQCNGLDVHEFWTLVEEVCLRKTDAQERQALLRTAQLTKLEQTEASDFEVDEEMVDALMFGDSSCQAKEVSVKNCPSQQRRPASQALSKKEKVKERLRKKLM